MGFHPTRRVHSVAPEIVKEAFRPDHPGDDRTRVDADPQRETGLAGHRRGREHVPHVQRQERSPARMVRVRVRHTRGRHVAIADRLDLLEPVPLHEHVEIGEELIEDADHLGRREALRERGEVHDVGEEDRGRGEVVGDHLGGGLQSLGDRARQDVQEERLRPLLLGSECRQRHVALVGERREECEGDRGGTDDVQRQHRARERHREIRFRDEHLTREAGQQEDHDEGSEPADRLTHLEEDECAERSKDAPQPDASGRKEPADQHLPGCRRQQDREELGDQEKMEASGSREHHQ